MQLDTLWNYMQVDLEADRFENDMRQAPNRQKLLKHRNFLMEQQTNMKKIETDITVMVDRMEALKDETERLNGLLAEQKADIEANAPKTIDEIQTKSQALSKLLDSLQRYEQELQKMRKDADTRDRQQKEIRVRAAKAKAEYDALKLQYDQEFSADSQKLKALRANADAEGKHVDEKLLSRYKTIKQHCSPPMAKLINNQCSGCFMSLPLGTLRDLKTGERMIECDNCGRILYAVE